MGKQFCIGVFVSLLVLLSSFQKTEAQCTPGFLGEDKAFIMCSETVTIDYSFLFQMAATYIPVALSPFDTLKGTGNQADTIIAYKAKIQVIAVLDNGCKDTAIVRVPLNRDPYPDAGRDTTVTICPGSRIDISGFNTSPLFDAGWTPSNVTRAVAGRYVFTVRTRDGCVDSAIVQINEFPKPDLGEDQTVVSGPNQKTDISKLVSGSSLSIVWNTSTPASVGPGTYWAIGTDTNGCTDTLIVEVCSKPLLNDTIVKVCPDQFRNLYGVYNLSGLIAEFDTPTPSAVSVGEYTIIVRNFCGGRDTAKIIVELGARPQIGDFREILACKDEKVNLTIYYDITDDLIFNWSLPDPEMAPIGRYSVRATNKDGCSSTSDIEVKPFEKPSFLNDTTVYVCGGTNRDLTTIFPYDELISYDWVGVSNPTSVPEGDYEVDVIDLQCIYRLKVLVKSEQTRKSELLVCNFTKGAPGVPFNTNNFRSILVDKNGFIWAGADGNGVDEGGLYRFIRTGPNCNEGSWTAVQSNRFTGFRDLHNSSVSGDNTIWSASNGNGAVGAVNGGVFRISDPNNITRFGSIDDNGPLRSRDVNTLAVSKNGLLYAGSFYYNPEFDEFRQGGVHEYNLLEPQTFTQVNGLQFSEQEVCITALGIRGDELWVAGARNVSTLGITFPPYIKRWSTSDHKSLGEINEGNSPIPFRTNNALVVRAIFTASSGKTFVGLSTGLAVLEESKEGINPKWHYLTHHNSAFPKDGSVSFNAITEVNGEIWIGTNRGILVYDGVGPVNECSSYTIYNTGNTENLLSNNIRDVAYDAVNKEIWLVTDAGVSRVVKTFMISGRVMNSYYGRYDRDLFPRRLSKPIDGAVVQLTTEDGQLISEVTTNAEGRFELPGGFFENQYRIDLAYRGFQFSYSDIKPNQFVGDLFVPDSLIKDLNFLYSILGSRNFNLKIPGAELINQFWKIPNLVIKGFDLTHYEDAIEPYKGEVVDNHEERLENLANYYVTLATINEIGFSATNLFDSSVLVVGELIVAAMEYVKIVKAINKYFDKLTGNNAADDITKNPAFKEAVDKMKIEVLSVVKDWMNKILDATVKSKLNEEEKFVYNELSLIVNQIFDQIIAAERNEDGLANLSTEDFIKHSVKLLSSYFSTSYYKYYTRVKHKEIVKNVGQAAAGLKSDEKYSVLYKKIYDKAQTGDLSSLSLLGKSLRIESVANEKYVNTKDLAQMSTLLAQISDIAALATAAATATAAFAAVFKAASVLLNVQTLSYLRDASIVAMLANNAVGALSTEVIPLSGLMSIADNGKVFKSSNFDFYNGYNLDSSYAALRQRFNFLKIAQSQNNDPLSYLQTLQEALGAHRNYEAILNKYIFKAEARYAKLGANNPDLGHTFDNFIQKDVLPYRLASKAFFFQQIGFMMDVEKVNNWDSLPYFTNNVIELAPVVNIGVTEILKRFDQLGIMADGYLVKSSFDDSTSAQHGTIGRIRYGFTNFGDKPIDKVSFSISPPEFGFQFISTPYIQFNRILPDETVYLDFYYSTPFVDTTAEYSLSIVEVADTVLFYRGLLVAKAAVDNSTPLSIKSGLWSDPTTWSTGLVPDATSAVIIRHEVTIDIDATCKTIRAENPAQVQVAAGKKLTVLE